MAGAAKPKSVHTKIAAECLLNVNSASRHTLNTLTGRDATALVACGSARARLVPARSSGRDKTGAVTGALNTLIISLVTLSVFIYLP
jgi:hypothetical protein